MVATCACGAGVVVKGMCRRCYARDYARKRAEHRTERPRPRGAFNPTRRPRKAAEPSAPAEPSAVTWDEMLSEIRRALPFSAVRLHAGGRVTIYPFGETPRDFPSLDAALDALTAPTAQ